MTKRWRLGRAALYGAITGAVLTLLGLFGAPPDPLPNDPVAHWYFMAGRWAGFTIICTLLFLVIAAIRNLLNRIFSI